MNIYLDDEVLEIRIKETGELILEGVYEKPNWKITFIILKRRNKEELDYETYNCKAFFINTDEKEVEDKNRNSDDTEIGREIDKTIPVISEKETNKNSKNQKLEYLNAWNLSEDLEYSDKIGDGKE